MVPALAVFHPLNARLSPTPWHSAASDCPIAQAAAATA